MRGGGRGRGRGECSRLWLPSMGGVVQHVAQAPRNEREGDGGGGEEDGRVQHVAWSGCQGDDGACRWHGLQAHRVDADRGKELGSIR